MKQYRLGQELHVKGFDLTLFFTALIISAFGVTTIFSAVYSGPIEDNKLWMTSLTVNKEQVLNMKKGLVNGKHSIMQPTGAVAILKWLDAHKESKDD